MGSFSLIAGLCVVGHLNTSSEVRREKAGAGGFSAASRNVCQNEYAEGEQHARRLQHSEQKAKIDLKNA
jgi:hypothetical protein